MVEEKEIPKSIQIQINSGTLSIDVQTVIEIITKELEKLVSQRDSVGY